MRLTRVSLVPLINKCKWSWWINARLVWINDSASGNSKKFIKPMWWLKENQTKSFSLIWMCRACCCGMSYSNSLGRKSCPPVKPSRSRFAEIAAFWRAGSNKAAHTIYYTWYTLKICILYFARQWCSCTTATICMRILSRLIIFTDNSMPGLAWTIAVAGLLACLTTGTCAQSKRNIVWSCP